MTKRYTAADFANAKFAEHPNVGVAARTAPHSRLPWESRSSRYSDEEMAGEGWVPVPTKPTITESQFARAAAGVWGDEGSGPTDSNGYARGFLFRLGVNVIPDPEPTNTERLAQLIGGGIKANKQYADGLAEYLDDMGVTAPNVKGN